MTHTEIPKHIAIIMDGNNRYAKAHALAKGAGHIKGKDALDPIVELCLERGVEILTVFAFSSENWKRPTEEVELLMGLLQSTIIEQIPRMYKYKVRLRFIGDRSKLGADLVALMNDAEQQTSGFDKMTLVIAISYGGQDDIAFATKQIATQVQNGELSASDVDSDLVGKYVALGDFAPVDMLIRTGGECRISNFLLWQIAYAELFFSQTLWPDFTPNELECMLEKFAQRQRRFGRTSEQLGWE